MCGELSGIETLAVTALLGTIALKGTVQTRLAAAGLAAPVDHVGRDARTVAFLRSLDLDPVEVLGAGVVSAADRWVPAPAGYRGWRWARPIGSHNRLIVQ